ncbi:GIN domain-containing protein [Sediminitomix flava]|uniref:Putative autotransporter adhesin-like protein n=1 Tax=Sediminitomix flava TaxID=379075 RepID=A0A315ZCH4_SEDFL|nr:DUF2807 domain-containing protein [Sediminitomix flava]PWJ43002.1 putative autotransporter adhesin-like protein [Sediminitomix flava]
MKTLLKISILLSLFCFWSCDDDDDINGSGESITREVDISNDFQGLDIRVPAQVMITQDDSTSITATGQENILNNLEYRINNDGILTIKFDRNVSSFEELILEISLSTLKEMRASGKAEITGLTPFRDLNDLDIKQSGLSSINLDSIFSEELEIDMSGESKLNIIHSTTQTEIDMSGNTSIDIEGTSQSTEIDMSGDSNIEGVDFNTESLEVDMSGSSNLTITVELSIDGQISGSSQIRYGGQPSVNVSTSGSSSIEPIN